MASRKSLKRGAGAVILVFGAVLSGSIEVVQVYTPRRVPSLLDLLSNTAGTAAGIAGAAAVEKRLRARGASIRGRTAQAAGALLLLSCFAASQVYPLAPQASLPALYAKLRTLASWESFSALELMAAAGDWAAAAVLLHTAVGGRSGFAAFCALLLLIPARFAIYGRTVTWTDLAAIPVALAGRALIARLPEHHYKIAAAALSVGIAARGLGPLASGTAGFAWVPFFPVFSFPGAVSIFLLKAFRYGALVWLLHAGGWRLRVATAAAVMLLSAVEAAQMWSPGHVPEITDPLLALLAGLALFALERYGGRVR
jgi:VanZ family protein